MDISETVAKQREFFDTGATLPYQWRAEALDTLEHVIVDGEDEINAALKEDLGKSVFESYMAEVGMTLSELRFVRKHLKRWMREKRVSTPLAQFPSRSFTIAEPYGMALVMSPWNYPFMLCMEPLVGAIAAGNCAVLKPSNYAKATSAVIRKLVAAAFPPEFVTTIEGGRRENQELLDQRFDYIFFTGGVQVGKLVMEKAAQNLTPVSLELGGKSPCIVDESANLSLAAKRLVFGKFLNCGQTCVAPDYVLVHESARDAFVDKVLYWTKRMYGEHPLENSAYGKMINEKHFQRVLGLITPDKVALGGGADADTLRIEPTVLADVELTDAVMGQEIFGPVLPVLTYSTRENLLQTIHSFNKPLALYLFTTSKAMERWVLRNISFGGGCVNDTITHLATSQMGFGGVGGSGMGSYHGQQSFETFSHRKSIMRKANWMDVPVRYAPYTSAHEKLLRLLER